MQRTIKLLTWSLLTTVCVAQTHFSDDFEAPDFTAANWAITNDGGACCPPSGLWATAKDEHIELSWIHWCDSLSKPLGLFYFEDPIDAQLGCSAQGVCELAVRFTPPFYPVLLESIDIFQQGAPTSAIDVHIYVDPGGSVEGPPLPAVQSHENVGGAEGWHSISLTYPILISAGDFYIGALEVDGYMGLGMDAGNQDEYIDRNWASVDGGANFDILFDIVGGDSTLYGNFGIVAWILGADGQRIPITQNIMSLKQYVGYAPQRMPTESDNIRLSNNSNRVAQKVNSWDSTADHKNHLKARSRKHSTQFYNENTEELLGFNIYRSGDGENFSMIGNVASTTLNYVDNSAEFDVEYSYYVTALCDVGESDASNVATAILPELWPQEQSHSTTEFVAAVTNLGSIGDQDPELSSNRLPGFQWPPGPSWNQLFEGGIMVGIGPDWVSDAARVISGGNQLVQDQDFLPINDIQVVQDNDDGQIYVATYSDEAVATAPLADDGPNLPLPITIEQTTYSFHDEGNTGYLIYEVALTNTGESDLDGLLIGAYFDWDVGQALFGNNTGSVFFEDVMLNGQHFELEFVEIHVNNNNSHPMIGHVPLSQNYFQSSWIIDNPNEVFPSGASSLTEANKYHYMSQRREDDPFGDPFGPADKGTIIGMGGYDGCYNISPGSTVVAAFAIVGGNDMDEFTENGIAAAQRWVDMDNDLVIVTDPYLDWPMNLQVRAEHDWVLLWWDAPHECLKGDSQISGEGFSGDEAPPAYKKAGSDISLNNSTANENNSFSHCLGHNIYRSEDGYSFELIGFAEHGLEYYTDIDDLLGTYWYYVTALFEEGESDPSNTVGPVEVTLDIDTENPLPLEFALEQNYPNPFNPSTVISYQLPVSSHVKLAVYDITGRRVSVLIDGQHHTPGYHEVVWDGTNDAGERVASGVHLYRLTYIPRNGRATTNVLTRKMLLTR